MISSNVYLQGALVPLDVFYQAKMMTLFAIVIAYMRIYVYIVYTYLLIYIVYVEMNKYIIYAFKLAIQCYWMTELEVTLLKCFID